MRSWIIFLTEYNYVYQSSPRGDTTNQCFLGQSPWLSLSLFVYTLHVQQLFHRTCLPSSPSSSTFIQRSNSDAHAHHFAWPWTLTISSLTPLLVVVFGSKDRVFAVSHVARTALVVPGQSELAPPISSGWETDGSQIFGGVGVDRECWRVWCGRRVGDEESGGGEYVWWSARAGEEFRGGWRQAGGVGDVVRGRVWKCECDGLLWRCQAAHPAGRRPSPVVLPRWVRTTHCWCSCLALSPR